MLPWSETRAYHCSGASGGVASQPTQPLPFLHPSSVQPVYAACKRLFSSLPLAARIAEATLVLHGGLFRRQPQRGGGPGKNKRKRALPLLHGVWLHWPVLLQCWTVGIAESHLQFRRMCEAVGSHAC